MTRIKFIDAKNPLKYLSLIIYISIGTSGNSVAQIKTTLDNYIGDWSTVASWVANDPPNPLAPSVGNQTNIYGWITRNGDLSFANASTLFDTLFVEGNLTIPSGFVQISVQSGSVLVIKGNLDDLGSGFPIITNFGGIVVVDGNLSLASYAEVPSSLDELYVSGTSTGTGTASANTLSELEINHPTLYNLIFGGLPITLSSFTVKTTTQSIVVKWRTESEIDFDHFKLQKSSNGLDFSDIASIEGMGNKSIGSVYSYIDENPIFGKSFYRLKAIDHDGSSETFETIQVNYKNNRGSVKIYPIPNKSQNIHIAIDHSAPITKKLEIYDNKGTILGFHNWPKDKSEFIIEHNYPPGTYHIKFQLENESISKRVVIE